MDSTYLFMFALRSQVQPVADCPPKYLASLILGCDIVQKSKTQAEWACIDYRENHTGSGFRSSVIFFFTLCSNI